MAIDSKPSVNGKPKKLDRPTNTVVGHIKNGFPARVAQYSGSAVKLWLALANRSNKDGKSWAKLDTLQKDAGLSRSVVVRSIGELEKAGELVVKRGRWGKREKNRYQIPLEYIKGLETELVKGLETEPIKGLESEPINRFKGMETEPIKGLESELEPDSIQTKHKITRLNSNQTQEKPELSYSYSTFSKENILVAFEHFGVTQVAERLLKVKKKSWCCSLLLRCDKYEADEGIEVAKSVCRKFAGCPDSWDTKELNDEDEERLSGMFEALYTSHRPDNSTDYNEEDEDGFVNNHD